MKKNFKNFITPEETTNYNSLVDEFRRYKYFHYSKSFNIKDGDDLFELLVKTIKHMFKIKRDLIEGIEFSLKVKNTFTKYKLDFIDKNTKKIIIAWENDGDMYTLEFIIRKKFLSNNWYIKFNQSIHRLKTFYGMSDFIGTEIFKHGFRSNMKIFCKYIKKILNDRKNGITETDLNLIDEQEQKIHDEKKLSKSKKIDNKKVVTNSNVTTNTNQQSKKKKKSSKKIKSRYKK